MSDYGITTCSKHNYSGTSLDCPDCRREAVEANSENQKHIHENIIAERDKYKRQRDELIESIENATIIIEQGTTSNILYDYLTAAIKKI